MNFGLKYLSWHYLQRTRQILAVMGSFLASGAYYFSAKDMLFSLFAPWKRETESFDRGFDLGNFLTIVIGNLISIAIGFLMRIFFLAIFLFFEIIVLIVGLSILIVWLAWPFLLISGVIYSIMLICNYV